MLPENVAEALGLHDGDEVEVVVRDGEPLLRKADGRRPREGQADTLPTSEVLRTHFPGRAAGAVPNPEQVLLLSQRLLRDFTQLGEAPRNIPTAQVMRELRGYDEYDEALPGDNGEPV